MTASASQQPVRRPPAQSTVASVIAALAAAFDQAGLCYGHGTTDARDEAAALVFHVLGLEHADWERAYARPVAREAEAIIARLAERRMTERRPLPYLLGEAWFGGLRFAVDENVLVPRSPFAELIGTRFAPWLAAGSVNRVLELGTGSGCIAVALALAFPGSRVLATDISAAALDVARRNIDRYGLGGRVSLVRADAYAGLAGSFELIVSNPPYVPEAELAGLPPEYAWEPRLALASGADGMSLAARIVRGAPAYLAPGGWLALEVGAGITRLETVFPGVPFIWPELEWGGEGIALVSRQDLIRGLGRE